MKFEINKNILVEGLRVVCNLLDTTSLNPVGDCVLIIVSKNNIKLFSTNSFLSSFYEINNNFTCSNEGKALIKGKLFYNIVSKLDNQTPIVIEIVDNSVIRIKQSKFSSDINLLDSDTFIVPDFNFSNWEKTTIQANDIKKILNKLVPCATTTDNKNIACNNVLVDASKKQGSIFSIGTDGNHLACLEIPHNNQPFKIVLNIQILKNISGFLNSEETTWFIKNKNLGLQFNNITLLIRTTEGEYPDLTKPLQTSLPNQITTNTNGLLNAVEKATLLTTSDKKPAVQISIDKNVLKITARSIEYGSTFEEITINNPSDASATFTFNSRYLINLLKNIDSSNVVIEFSTNNKPVFIKEENNSNYTSLILPIISF